MEEVFKISKIQLTIPVTYEITQGSYYEKELKKKKQDIFRLEKIIN